MGWIISSATPSVSSSPNFQGSKPLSQNGVQGLEHGLHPSHHGQARAEATQGTLTWCTVVARPRSEGMPNSTQCQSPEIWAFTIQQPQPPLPEEQHENGVGQSVRDCRAGQ